MKTLSSLLLCFVLTACATTPAPQAVDKLFDDAAFSPSATRIDPNDVFALNEAMRRYLEDDIARKVYADGKIMALVNALYYNKQRLKMSYDATKTRNAADTFDARSGNCLSLTIMTAAFARQMGLPVQFHEVFNGEVWDRNDSLEFRIGHVNLSVGRDTGVRAGQESARIVDFAAGENIRDEDMNDIGEDVIVAMYLNNRAAEALAKGDVNEAYWWARAALAHTPSYLDAYNTLGVIYIHHDNQLEADKVFAYVLQYEPDNVLAMSNRIQALKALGRTAEAQTLASRLAKIQPNPPYFFFHRGLNAMQAGNFKQAKVEFTKEVNRASYNHQFHFWLALANYYLGNLAETRKQLTIAMENSPNNAQHDLYAAKLAGLSSSNGLR